MKDEMAVFQYKQALMGNEVSSLFGLMVNLRLCLSVKCADLKMWKVAA